MAGLPRHLGARTRSAAQLSCSEIPYTYRRILLGFTAKVREGKKAGWNPGPVADLRRCWLNR